MTRCDRFERERLLDIELGRPADEHFTTCPDCKEAERKRRALVSLLGHVGEDREPPAGWEEATRARIVAAGRQRRLRAGAWVVGVAAAAAIAVFALRPRPHEIALALTVSVSRGTEPMRGTTPRPGDHLVIHAELGGRDPDQVELRVYRGERELVSRCSSAPPCVSAPGRLDADVVLPWPGRFRAVLLAGAAAPPPAGLDEDASRVIGAGGAAILSLPVEVY